MPEALREAVAEHFVPGTPQAATILAIADGFEDRDRAIRALEQRVSELEQNTLRRFP